MSLFQQAVDLSNDGVDSLLQGEHDTAIDQMGKAIKLMRSDLATLEIEGEQESAHSMQSIETIEIPSMASSDTIAFNQAIRIPAQTTLSSFEKNVYTSAAVYNYALAHQCKASTGDVRHLDKAEKLYTMANKMTCSSSLNKAHLAVVIKLTSINNLTQIRYDKGDFVKAREGYKQVSRLVRASTTDQAMFQVPEIQGLVMSVLLLKAPTVAKAA